MKLILFLLVAVSFLCFACQSAENPQVNVNSTPTPEKKRDEFQDAFNSVKVGGFDYIFVFRRPDNAPLTSEDKAYLKANSPADTNRWNLTEEGKVAIAGSNYKFTPANLEALKKRFVVEDYSKVKQENGANDNANSANK